MSARLIDFPANPVCPSHAAPPRGLEPARVRVIRAALASPGAPGRPAIEQASAVVEAIEGLPLAEAAVHVVRGVLGRSRVALHHPAWRGALTPGVARLVAAAVHARPYGPGAFVLAVALNDAADAAEVRLGRHGPLNPRGPAHPRDPHVTGLGFLTGLCLLLAAVLALAFWPA